MAHPHIAHEGNGLQPGRVAVSILSKQSLIAEKGWSSRQRVCVGGGGGTAAPHPKKSPCYTMLHRALDLNTLIRGDLEPGM
jgi:hypothetical protein